MNKVSKLLCILVLVFSFFIFACGEEETNDKENLGFSLPTEESILNKLGENYYFKIVEKIEGFETVKEYYSTKEGYFVSITEDDVNTSYLYLKGVNEFYLGDNKKLTLKDNDDLYEGSYGMDYIGFFEGEKVEKESDLEITVNGRDVNEYMPFEVLVMDLKQPLELTNNLETFDIECNVTGGGFSGQTGAIRLGITRALMEYDKENEKNEDSYRKVLKKAGMVTRDPRAKERKKPGLKAARTAPQFSKR